MVRCRIPRLVLMASHNDDVKLVPLSEVIVSGRPNVEIQLMSAVVQVSAEMSLMGIASGHLVALSIIVNR